MSSWSYLGPDLANLKTFSTLLLFTFFFFSSSFSSSLLFLLSSHHYLRSLSLQTLFYLALSCFFKRSWARRWWSSRWSGSGWSAAPPSRQGLALANGHRPSISPQKREKTYDGGVPDGDWASLPYCSSGPWLVPTARSGPPPTLALDLEGSTLSEKFCAICSSWIKMLKYEWNFLKVAPFNMASDKTLLLEMLHHTFWEKCKGSEILTFSRFLLQTDWSSQKSSTFVIIVLPKKSRSKLKVVIFPPVNAGNYKGQPQSGRRCALLYKAAFAGIIVLCK